MSWDSPWVVVCVLCAAVAVAFIWVSSNNPDEDRPGPFAIVVGLVLFLAALNLFS